MSAQVLAVFLSTAQPWQVEVTGYCPCSLCCGRWAVYGITASGVPAKGKLVAAPREIPFGTQIYVPGYAEGPVTVLDRGGAIKGDRLDLLFPTHAQAAQWGKRKMIVYTSPREQKPDASVRVATAPRPAAPVQTPAPPPAKASVPPPAKTAPSPPAKTPPSPPAQRRMRTTPDAWAVRDAWLSREPVIAFRLSPEMARTLTAMHRVERLFPREDPTGTWFIRDESD
jgi:3D (Asp-Asp-Asp) domain-containing protein